MELFKFISEDDIRDIISHYPPNIRKRAVDDLNDVINKLNYINEQIEKYNLFHVLDFISYVGKPYYDLPVLLKGGRYSLDIKGLKWDNVRTTENYIRDLYKKVVGLNIEHTLNDINDIVLRVSQDYTTDLSIHIKKREDNYSVGSKSPETSIKLGSIYYEFIIANPDIWLKDLVAELEDTLKYYNLVVSYKHITFSRMTGPSIIIICSKDSLVDMSLIPESYVKNWVQFNESRISLPKSLQESNPVYKLLDYALETNERIKDKNINDYEKVVNLLKYFPLKSDYFIDTQKLQVDIEKILNGKAILSDKNGNKIDIEPITFYIKKLDKINLTIDKIKYKLSEIEDMFLILSQDFNISVNPSLYNSSEKAKSIYSFGLSSLPYLEPYYIISGHIDVERIELYKELKNELIDNLSSYGFKAKSYEKFVAFNRDTYYNCGILITYI